MGWFCCRDLVLSKKYFSLFFFVELFHLFEAVYFSYFMYLYNFIDSFNEWFRTLHSVQIIKVNEQFRIYGKLGPGLQTGRQHFFLEGQKGNATYAHPAFAHSGAHAAQTLFNTFKEQWVCRVTLKGDKQEMKRIRIGWNQMAKKDIDIISISISMYFGKSYSVHYIPSATQGTRKHITTTTKFSTNNHNIKIYILKWENQFVSSLWVPKSRNEWKFVLFDS